MSAEYCLKGKAGNIPCFLSKISWKQNQPGVNLSLNSLII